MVTIETACCSRIGNIHISVNHCGHHVFVITYESNIGDKLAVVREAVYDQQDRHAISVKYVIVNTEP